MEFFGSFLLAYMLDVVNIQRLMHVPIYCLDKFESSYLTWML